MQPFSLAKTCRQCSASFTVTAEDLAFYEKVSPVFNGKKELILPPTLCPECRHRRRLAFRNERRLYKRKCDLSGKDIISIYSPDKPYMVYEQNTWWGDAWDPLVYGQAFDFSQSFSQQLARLYDAVPKMSLLNMNSENSEYCNNSYNEKDCYLIFVSGNDQNCYYSYTIANSKDCMDCLWTIGSTQCYECVKVENCYGCLFCYSTRDSSNSQFLYNCVNCHDCAFCVGMQNQKNCFLNQQCTAQQYQTYIQKLQMDTQFAESTRAAYQQLVSSRPHAWAYQQLCENCTGDAIVSSKNCHKVFDISASKDCAYCWDCLGCLDTYDSFNSWALESLYGHARNLEGTNIVRSTNTSFVLDVWDNQHTYYSIHCFASSFIFGCVGLRNKQYCILNKQYTKEEYEALVPKIIEHMRKTGEWGEFFSPSLSPFGYNETVATEYFPLSKEEALKLGFNWSDYEAPFPKVEKTIPADKLPEDTTKIPDDILGWAIVCEITGKPFRIIKQELEFYRKHNLPIPKRHPDQRHLDRMTLRNPRKLYTRACDKCGTAMQTTYAPERPEQVYCETCYNKEVYG